MGLASRAFLGFIRFGYGPYGGTRPLISLVVAVDVRRQTSGLIFNLAGISSHGLVSYPAHEVNSEARLGPSCV